MRLSRLFACAILSWLAWLAPHHVCAEPPDFSRSASISRIQVDLSSTTPLVASADESLTDTDVDFDPDHDADLDVHAAIGPPRELTPVERPRVAAGTAESGRSAAAPRAPPSSRH